MANNFSQKRARPSPENNPVVLVGYSGHGYVVANAAQEAGYHVKYYMEIEPVDYNPFNLEYLGCERKVGSEVWSKDLVFILGIGDNSIRKEVADLINSKGKEILNVVHPTVTISKGIKMGTGNFFASSVSIPPLVEIGDNCILNTGCIVEHECVIGSNVHIAPGAVLAGNVAVGDGAFVGANAVVKEGVHIGRNAIIGAGTVVLKDVKFSQTMVGNPGISLPKKQPIKNK